VIKSAAPSSIAALLVPLCCFVILSACSNEGSDAPNTITSSGPPPPPTPVQSVISDCGTTVGSPGTYFLNSGLTTNSGAEPCITITDTENVTLNCNGNSITGTGEYGISGLNVDNLIITNCNVATGTGDGLSTLLGLSNINGGTITNSTFGSSQADFGAVVIHDSTNVIFGSQLPRAPANASVTATTNPSISTLISGAPQASNMLYGFIISLDNVNVFIEGNALTSGTSTALNGYLIGILSSQNTQVVNNTLDGLGSPLPIVENGIFEYLGTDDDILIQDETGPGSLISGNILVNTFDCGIETVGFMKNITLSSNYIDTVSTGIGGWYLLSVTGARFLRNVMTNIEYMGFRYFRIGGLRPASSKLPAETTINFTQNEFTGNILAQPLIVQGVQLRAVEAYVYSMMGYVPSPRLPGTDPAPGQFITVGNSFTNNRFDNAFGPLVFSAGPPWTYTSDDVIDGGGNICSGSQNLVPLVSPTFTTQWVPTTQSIPINCGSGN